MGRILRDILSGTDNETVEAGRVLWVISVLSLIVFQGVAIWWKDQTFSPTEFGLGIGGILAAGGVGVAQKDRALAKVKESEA